MADPIPCPFVYSTGKRCTGHVAKVEAYKADLEWSFDTGNGWTFSAGEPRSHYHVFCSEKGNHAGVTREDALKLSIGTEWGPRIGLQKGPLCG